MIASGLWQERADCFSDSRRSLLLRYMAEVLEHDQLTASDITLEAARENGASLPLTATVDQYYADVPAMGGARWDTSSLIARLTRGT